MLRERRLVRPRRVPEASFAGAYIESAIFTDANLYKSNFTHARGVAPNFEKAHLSGSNFSHAYLPMAIFTNADLSGVDFSDAAIRYADLEAVKVESDRLSKARDLSHSRPYRVRLFSSGQSRSLLTSSCLKLAALEISSNGFRQ